MSQGVSLQRFRVKRHRIWLLFSVFAFVAVVVHPWIFRESEAPVRYPYEVQSFAVNTIVHKDGSSSTTQKIDLTVTKKSAIKFTLGKLSAVDPSLRYGHSNVVLLVDGKKSKLGSKDFPDRTKFTSKNAYSGDHHVEIQYRIPGTVFEAGDAMMYRNRILSESWSSIIPKFSARILFPWEPSATKCWKTDASEPTKKAACGFSTTVSDGSYIVSISEENVPMFQPIRLETKLAAPSSLGVKSLPWPAKLDPVLSTQVWLPPLMLILSLASFWLSRRYFNEHSTSSNTRLRFLGIGVLTMIAGWWVLDNAEPRILLSVPFALWLGLLPTLLRDTERKLFYTEDELREL